MGHVKCKLWLPKNLLVSSPDTGIFLFGWYFDSGSDSVNVVVAAGVSVEAVFQSDLQEVLRDISEKMPVRLRESSTITIVGHLCVVSNCENSDMTPSKKSYTLHGERDCNGIYQRARTRENKMSNSSCDSTANHSPDEALYEELTYSDVLNMPSCGCHKINIAFEKDMQYAIRKGCWIQLSSESQGTLKRTRWIPTFNHLYHNGQLDFFCHLHVVIYDPPRNGSQHFSLNIWNSWIQAGSLKKPNWLMELQKKNLLHDLETVVLCLNCSEAAKDALEGCLATTSCSGQTQTRYMLTAFSWHIMAVCVATISTSIYIFIQLWHKVLVYASQSSVFTISTKLFHHAWTNIHLRLSQLQYWPIFLPGIDDGSHPNTEYMHRASLRRHAIWSSVVVDVLLGNMVGLLLLGHVEAIFFWFSGASVHVTDSLLRSGCAWLMGVPAGFKLNTELAELFGIISLNAIQIWSTLWSFMGLFFGYIIIGLALSGQLLGLTIPTSICIDMLKILTLHISALHWFISFFYSQQIQMLASLWRLFRSQKWNPLRQRLDSFEYTVEEHVVGSLLFTPVLLLLPTTTNFYIFFTIMKSTVDLICLMVEMMISILHVTPYAEIFLWILRRGRFPSGVWFEPMESEILDSPSNPEFLNHWSSSNESLSENRDQNHTSKRTTTFFVLHNNCAGIGQILGPPFRKVFAVFSLASSKRCVFAVLCGQRLPGTLRMYQPPAMPWIKLSLREYWNVCYSAVLSCGS